LTAAYYCSQRPNGVFDKHAKTLVAYAEECLSQDQSAWVLSYCALVHFRAGNRERSLALLEQSSYKSYEPPLQALLAHQAGDAPMARKFLQGALAVAAQYEASRQTHSRSAFHGKNHFDTWYEWASFLTLLREAEHAILGETIESDALRARCEA